MGPMLQTKKASFLNGVRCDVIYDVIGVGKQEGFCETAINPTCSNQVSWDILPSVRKVSIGHVIFFCYIQISIFQWDGFHNYGIAKSPNSLLRPGGYDGVNLLTEYTQCRLRPGPLTGHCGLIGHNV